MGSFLNASDLEEHVRDRRGFVWLDIVRQDVRNALRLLQKNAGCTCRPRISRCLARRLPWAGGFGAARTRWAEMAEAAGGR